MKVKVLTFKAQKKFENRKFILSVGEDGAILSYIINNVLTERLYSSLTSEVDLKKIQRLFDLDPDTPIKILVDTSDQSYVQQTLPGASSFSLNKLTQRRLNKDLGSSDLKGSLILGKLKSGKNDWNLILIGCSLTSPLKEWVDFASLQTNPLTGIYLLPVECGELVKKINQSQITKDKKGFFSIFSKKKSEKKLQLLVIHNKVGGFRQIVFYGNKVIFTRLIEIQQNESMSYITGNVEQEISNTLEYLKRLSFIDKATLEVIIIVSQEIKNNLQNTKLQVKNIFVYTPYEISKKIGLKNAAQEEDKFSDVITAVNFATSKPTLRLITPALNELLKYINITKAIHIFSILILLLGISLGCYRATTIFLANKEIIEKTHQNDALTRDLNKLKAETSNLDQLSKMTDMISLYNILIKNNISPLNIIERFNQVKTNALFIKSITWRSQENITAPNNPQETGRSSITVFDSEFSNNQTDYQKLFDDFDDFINSVEINFKDYNIEYTRNTEKISFDNLVKKIPIKITISSLKNDAKKGN